MEEKPLKWKGKNLRLMKDVFEAALACKDKEEAAQFVQAWVRAGGTEDIAKQNLGYFAGYYGDPKVGQRIFDLFGAEHPIFGRTTPTKAEAFSVGLAMGEKFKQGKS